MPLMFPATEDSQRLYAALVANLSSLTLDFVARQKVGGTHSEFLYHEAVTCASPRQLHRIRPRLHRPARAGTHLHRPRHAALGARPRLRRRSPSPWTPSAAPNSAPNSTPGTPALYGLTRDELRYILDPADIEGPDYPSETFRVLKNNEIRDFGEYRTQRLVLDAWDRLNSREANAEQPGDLA